MAHVSICINEWDRFLTDDVIKAVISHEIGHAYGLHEAYEDATPVGLSPTPTPTATPYSVVNPCTSITSIMDGGYKELMDPNDPSKREIYVRHCDSLTGPHQSDIDHVNEMYVDGTLARVKGVDNDNGTAKFSWQDDVWGETRHKATFMYSNDLNDDDSWVIFGKTPEHAGIEWTGQHRNIKDQDPQDAYIFESTVSLSSHMTTGEDLPRWTRYRACVRAYFERVGGYGPERCSNEVIVDNEGLPTFTPTPTTKPKPTATRTPRPSRPTATPRPPTATPKPPTATPKPPTATPRPPTATPKPPTATPKPPTATPKPPTATPRPSAATPMPTPTTHPCDINPLDCPHWFR